MSSRDLSVVLLKLLGVYYLAEAALAFLSMVSSVGVTAGLEGVERTAMVGTQFAYVAVAAGISAICIFLAEPIVEWLFPGVSDKSAKLPNPADLLSVGIILVGVVLVASNLVGVMGFVVEFIWYLEGSRRDMLPDFWNARRIEFIPQVGVVAVGVVLCTRSQALGSYLWSREAAGSRKRRGK